MTYELFFLESMEPNTVQDDVTGHVSLGMQYGCCNSWHKHGLEVAQIRLGSMLESSRRCYAIKSIKSVIKYSRTPLIRIIWDAEPSGHAGNNRIIGCLFENRLHWKFEAEKIILQTAVVGYIFIYVQIK